MRSPNVSGALTYKELVTAAKNEERRQTELEKRKQYQNPPKTQTNPPPPKTSQTSTSTPCPKPQSSGRSSKFCDYCHKPGHWKRDCRHRIRSESSGQSSHPQRQSTSITQANTRTIQTSSSPAAKQAAVDPLSLLYLSLIHI